MAEYFDRLRAERDNLHTKDNLATLKNGNSGDPAVIRLAAQCWAVCMPGDKQPKVSEDIRDIARSILWNYCRLNNIQATYESTRFLRFGTPHTSQGNQYERVTNDALNSWKGDIGCGPGRRREIRDQILMTIPNVVDKPKPRNRKTDAQRKADLLNVINELGTLKDGCHKSREAIKERAKATRRSCSDQTFCRLINELIEEGKYKR